MRVISGKYRGRKIETVKGRKLRPTTGIAREALFNILSHGNFVSGDTGLLDGCRVLDLYCGCGALSMEALSRGAAKAVLVDIDQKHLDIARTNITKLGEKGNASFIKADSSNPPAPGFDCNLIFMDPPYGEGLAATTLGNLAQSDWLAKDAIIVVETAKNEDIGNIEGLEEIDNRKYGNSRIRILQAA